MQFKFIISYVKELLRTVKFRLFELELFCGKNKHGHV